MLNQNELGFENKLLAKIKEEKISPKPRWQFLLKNYVIWSFGFISLIIGAAAISVMIYLFRFNDWEIYEQTRKTVLEYFILTLPYFWFIFLGIFIFIIFYNLKHTNKGYRYSGFLLASASIILSIILGTIFYAAGLGKSLDDILGRRAPFYDQMINRHLNFWSQPQEGRLSGLIIAQNKVDEFILVDRRQEEWLIQIIGAVPNSHEMIIIGQPIRLLGEEVDKKIFRVDKIFLANTGRGFFHRFDNRPPRPHSGFFPPDLIISPAPF
jgi:hypothetical protein